MTPNSVLNLTVQGFYDLCGYDATGEACLWFLVAQDNFQLVPLPAPTTLLGLTDVDLFETPPANQHYTGSTATVIEQSSRHNLVLGVSYEAGTLYLRNPNGVEVVAHLRGPYFYYAHTFAINEWVLVPNVPSGQYITRLESTALVVEHQFSL